MAEAMDPTGEARQIGSSHAADPRGAAGQASPTTGEARRPTLITFAAYMLILMGGFSLVWAVLAFTQAEWLRNAYAAYGVADLGGYTWLWGFFDLFIAALAVYAGVAVLRGGGPVVQVLALSIVGLSAMRWFFFLPISPVAAVIVIALDILVVYGLIAHTEWFGDVRLPM